MASVVRDLMVDLLCAADQAQRDGQDALCVLNLRSVDDLAWHHPSYWAIAASERGALADWYMAILARRTAVWSARFAHQRRTAVRQARPLVA